MYPPAVSRPNRLAFLTSTPALWLASLLLIGPGCDAKTDSGVKPTKVTKAGDPEQPKTEKASQPAPVNSGEAVTLKVRDCKKSSPESVCCDYDFGIDPEALAKACGYASYLGEHRTTTTCQMRFESGRLNPTAITLARFEQTPYQDALARHMSGFFGLSDGNEVPTPGHEGPVHYSGLGKLAWAYVDGWSAPRRVAWSQKECSQDQLKPVFAAMAKAPEVKAVIPQVARQNTPRPLLAASAEGLSDEKGSLLTRYIERTLEPPKDFKIPLNSMRLIVMVLERAAKDSLAHFDLIFSKSARAGLPDRRMLRSAPIRGTDGGYTFMTRFRNQAQRFGHGAKFSCPPLTPADTKAVNEGEMGMWCAYSSQDDLDLMVFSLIIEDGEAKVAYVGFFDERPPGPMKADGEPPAPPVRISDVKRATARADMLNRPDSVNLNPGTGQARPQPPRPSAPPAPSAPTTQ